MSEQKYPRWFKSINNGQIVKFDGLQSGEVVVSGAYHKKGAYVRDWTIHTNTDVWQEVPNPELTREHEKAMMIDQDGIDRLLDEVDKLDDKSHLDNILAERGAKYGSYKAQAKCVGDIILATQEVAKANGKEQTSEQIGSIAYLAIKIARYANNETGDTLDDLENYAKLTRMMEQENV